MGEKVEEKKVVERWEGEGEAWGGRDMGDMQGERKR